MGIPAIAPVVAARRGRNFVVPRSASLPATCVKCGASATTPWRQKFYWHSPWLYLMILFPGLLIYIIVAIIVRKQMELNLPLCEAHHQDRKRYRLLGMLMLLGFIPVGFILGMYVSEGLGWATGALMLIAGLVFFALSNMGIGPKKIDESGGEFRGACDKFLDLLPMQP